MNLINPRNEKSVIVKLIGAVENIRERHWIEIASHV